MRVWTEWLGFNSWQWQWWDFFSLLPYPDWLWGPPNLLYNGYWGSYPTGKVARAWLSTGTTLPFTFTCSYKVLSCPALSYCMLQCCCYKAVISSKCCMNCRQGLMKRHTWCLSFATVITVVWMDWWRGRFHVPPATVLWSKHMIVLLLRGIQLKFLPGNCECRNFHGFLLPFHWIPPYYPLIQWYSTGGMRRHLRGYIKFKISIYILFHEWSELHYFGFNLF
jgi:hypothetical protein